MLIYLLYLIIIIIIFFYLRFKYLYKFWILQPVFHFYDFHYYFCKPQVINDHLSNINKYVDFINIKTMPYSDVSQSNLQKMLFLIRNHYYRNTNDVFNPSIDNFSPYFVGHNGVSLISVYYQNEFYKDKLSNIIEHPQIIGVITSRPVTIKLNNDKFKTYYVDYLCVNKRYRKKGIAPKLIQTHEYQQRRINKQINTSLFKREGELTGIVPLCYFETFCYKIHTLIGDSLNLEPGVEILAIDKQNIQYLIHFIDEIDNFNCIIHSDLANIINLITSKNITIFIALKSDSILSAFFYRKTCAFHDEKELICLFASIKSPQLSTKVFYEHFQYTIHNYFYNNIYLTMENISDNVLLSKQIANSQLINSSPTAYFLYNYISQPIKADKVLILV